MDFTYAQIMTDNVNHEIVPDSAASPLGETSFRVPSHVVKQVGYVPDYNIIRRSKSCANFSKPIEYQPTPWFDILGMTVGIVTIFGGLFMMLE
jgi:hypothetical protein